MTDRVYLVPVGSRFSPRLRLRPARNNQKRGIQLAADYELENWSLDSLLQIVREARSESGESPSFA